MTAARPHGDGTPTFHCRRCEQQDDAALRVLMAAQMQADPGWPPDYAKSLDLAEWLRGPTDLGRWVAVDGCGMVVGHVGLGSLSEGPVAEALCAALNCRCTDLGEIRRMVVAPAARLHGVGSLLTRRAMRASIETGRIPVATVLDNRNSWLTMMVATGWRQVAVVPSRVSEGILCVLAPAPRFVTLARSYASAE